VNVGANDWKLAQYRWRGRGGTALRSGHDKRNHRQTVAVSAADQKIAEWPHSEAGRFQVGIPSAIVATGHLGLRFDLPNASSAAQFGLNDDRALLGVQAVALTLQPLAKN
jgi:hypothetical protein